MLKNRKNKDDIKQTLVIRRPNVADKSIDFINWTPVQQQLFFLVIGGINWNNELPNNVIALDNKKAGSALGWDCVDFQSVEAEIRNQLDYMISHSALRLQNSKTGRWRTSNLITDVYGDSLTTYVVLNSYFMSYFKELEIFKREEIIMRRQKIYDCYKKEFKLPTEEWLNEYDSNVVEQGGRVYSELRQSQVI